MINKYKGSLIYSAIGDSLGWITEFVRNKEELNKKYGMDEIDSFISWGKNVGGRFYGYKDTINAGSYSDDTQLMLAVARSIALDKDVDQDYFGKVELANWIYYARGAGATIKNAARKIKRKNASWNNNFFNYTLGKKKLNYKDSGANGAAMRVLPIALANIDNIGNAFRNTTSNAIITHGHPTAIIGACLYSLSIHINAQYKLDNFNPVDYLVQLGNAYKEHIKPSLLKEPALDRWLEKWNSEGEYHFDELFKKSYEIGLKGLRDIYNSVNSSKSENEVLDTLGCFNKATKGSGIATVLAGIYFYCKNYHSPFEGMVKAVNMIGTDTDSIAGFYGGLIGLLHGNDTLESKFKSLQDYHYIETIADQLYQISISKSDYEPPTINDGDLNDIKEDNFNINQNITFNPLGEGIITGIDRQDTLVEGKYNLILNADFNIGQTCVFSKIFSHV